MKNFVKASIIGVANSAKSSFFNRLLNSSNNLKKYNKYSNELVEISATSKRMFTTKYSVVGNFESNDFIYQFIDTPSFKFQPNTNLIDLNKQMCESLYESDVILWMTRYEKEFKKEEIELMHFLKENFTHKKIFLLFYVFESKKYSGINQQIIYNESNQNDLVDEQNDPINHKLNTVNNKLKITDSFWLNSVGFINNSNFFKKLKEIGMNLNDEQRFLKTFDYNDNYLVEQVIIKYLFESLEKEIPHKIKIGSVNLFKNSANFLTIKFNINIPKQNYEKIILSAKINNISVFDLIKKQIVKIFNHDYSMIDLNFRFQLIKSTKLSL